MEKGREIKSQINTETSTSPKEHPLYVNLEQRNK